MVAGELKPAGHLTADEVAALLGIKASTWRSYVAREQAPKPAGSVGRTPLWLRADVEGWAASRPGQGARTDRR